MMARLQRAVILSLVVLAMAWWQFAADRGWGLPFRAIGALLILMPHSLVLALEFAFLWRFSRGAGTAPTLRQLALAWWHEVLTGLRFFGWHQPFRSRTIDDHTGAGVHGHRGVLLVHGFVCNRGMWNPWMRAFRRLDVPFIAVNLEPVFAPIEDYVPIVDAAVRRLETATGLPPIIVAHSMGGLAVRAWMHADGSCARVRRVITVATPHQGTWLARFALTPNGRQMRWRSRWIAALMHGDTPAVLDRFTCFYGHCDNIVLPSDAAMLPGADNRHLAGAAHLDMVHRPGVFRTVLDALS